MLKFSGISSQSCGTKYNITLGNVGNMHHPSVNGQFSQICTAFDDTKIYQNFESDLYLFFVEPNFWIVSSRIGGPGLVFKIITQNPPGCPGVNGEGIWAIFTGTGQVSFQIAWEHILFKKNHLSKNSNFIFLPTAPIRC